jgi:hypothetical protein
MPKQGEINRSEPYQYMLAQLTAMPTECTRWPFLRSADGYGRVRVDGRERTAHTVVCEWYRGPRPEGAQARHLCGNGHLGCFTPGHLAWGTPAENSADRVAHGRSPVGETNVNAVLTEAQVIEIRARYRGSQRTGGQHTGPSQRELAEEYGVTQQVISAILARRSWKNVL